MSPLERLEWLRRVLMDGDVPAPGKIAAALLAVMTNDDTGEAHPGRDYIAAHTGLSTGAVWTGLRALESRGHLRREGTRGRSSCRYFPTRRVVTGSTRHVVTGSDSPTRHVVNPTRHVANANPSRGDVEQGNEQGMNKNATNGDAFAFPVRGGSTWHPSPDLISKLTAAHPGIDVAAVLRKAALWCEANPAKRKTVAGMPRFITSWAARDAERHGDRHDHDDGGAMSEAEARHLLGLSPEGAL